MVEKGCESCREWQERCYWEHMDVTKIRFFKFMTGDFARGIVSVNACFVFLYMLVQKGDRKSFPDFTKIFCSII